MAVSVELAPMARKVEAPRWFRLARRVEEAGRLMRLNRPIGIWLLMWPMLWALWIASDGRPRPDLLTIFLLGAVVMRSAGCIINDFADRNVDPFVRRTCDRPLAARRISPYEALVWFVCLSAAALSLAVRLDRLTLELACIGAALTVSYPFLKRFFPLPQLYLGFAFGWGVPMAFAAQTGHLSRVAWLVFLAAVILALVYDTLYAMADREDDLTLGVRSSAILFGDLDRAAIAVLQVLVLATLAMIGTNEHLGSWYAGGVAAAALFFVYQQWLIRARAPAACFAAFLNNNYVGMAVFIGLLLDKLYRTAI
jgi:4-hydroxybenzoate polyprenyltransferase